MATMYKEIQLDVADGIATITLNRPARLNALTTRMTREILDAQSTCKELAVQLAKGPTRAIGLTKRVLNQVAAIPLAEALDAEAQVQDIASGTEDHQESVTAFRQRRQPHFKGR